MSYTAQYQPFFNDLVERLEQASRGLPRHKAESDTSWIKIYPKEEQYWFSCSFSEDGFRVNLTFQFKDERANKDAVDYLKKRQPIIEAELAQEGIDTNLLDWDHLDDDRSIKGIKRRDICLIRPEAANRAPEILNDPNLTEEYKQWAVETIPKFVKVFHPKVEAYLRQKTFGW